MWVRSEAIIFFVVFIFKDALCAMDWDLLRCSSDPDQNVPEGRVADIGRFPWLGVVQHNFYLGGKTRFALTNGALVHPAYAVASAEDISRIPHDALVNNTKFIVWHSDTLKYSFEVEDYFLHPEYNEDITYATLALLQLAPHGMTGVGAVAEPVLPVCLPVKGAGTFADLYAIKMSDETGQLHKEVFKMDQVKNQDCEEFYYRAKLHHKKMSPVSPFCAVSVEQTQSCVWDGGVALVTRQKFAHWTLIGFSARGPGCGAPSRFIYIHRYISWIDEVITRLRTELKEKDQVILFRRVSPIKLVMYSAKTRVPAETGMCDRKTRGHVLFKDVSELLVNKNFIQGFFFLSVMQVATINCAVISLEVNSRTNAAIWIEHHCHRDLSGDKMGTYHKDVRPRECFMYFKSEANIEFRFYFSFRAVIELTLYGFEDLEKVVPNPYPISESTYMWMPTYTMLKTYWFMPHYVWWWYM